VTRTQRLWLTFGPAALAASGIGIALTLTSDHEENPLRTIAIYLFITLAFIAAGLIGWSRRPQNRTGALMVAVGFSLFIGALNESDSPVPFTVGFVFGTLFVAIFIHLLLAFPSGRLTGRLEQALVPFAYGLTVLVPLSLTFFTDPLVSGCDECPASAFLVYDNDTVSTVITVIGAVLALAVALLTVTLLFRRWRSASPHARRTLTPILVAGGSVILLVVLAAILSPISETAANVPGYGALIPFTAVPFFFLGGLLRSQLAGGTSVGKIFWDIPEEPTRDEVQAGFRAALHDPTLQLAYWYPEGGHYVDVEGNRFDLPEDTAECVTTRIEYADRPVAALVHDASLREEPELLDTIVGAARIALERDRLQVELRARAERYRALLAAMPDLMFHISREGRYLGYNAPDDRDLIVTEVVGLTLWERLPPELAERVMDAGLRALEEGTAQVIEYEVDFDGDTRHYEGRFAASGDAEFLMIVREITERKRQQQELEASRARIVAAGDEARRKLERNLHDGAQQRLVSLSLSLRLAQNQVHKDPDGAEQLLEASRDELAQALEELRELARGIHPAVLTDRGLEAALESLAARAPLPVQVDASDRELPPSVEAAAYYVVSEALANVTKYAQASAVQVTVGRANGYALVEVEDNGVGGADPGRGSGLRGLADRVASLNGRLAVDSPPGAGTRVRAEIPLE
jgi:PAS domain S-box-containing protein